MRILSVLVLIIAFAFSLSAEAGNKGGGGTVRSSTGATTGIPMRKAGGNPTTAGTPYLRMNSGLGTPSNFGVVKPRAESSSFRPSKATGTSKFNDNASKGAKSLSDIDVPIQKTYRDIQNKRDRENSLSTQQRNQPDNNIQKQSDKTAEKLREMRCVTTNC